MNDYEKAESLTKKGCYVAFRFLFFTDKCGNGSWGKIDYFCKKFNLDPIHVKYVPEAIKRNVSNKSFNEIVNTFLR